MDTVEVSALPNKAEEDSSEDNPIGVPGSRLQVLVEKMHIVWYRERPRLDC